MMRHWAMTMDAGGLASTLGGISATALADPIGRSADGLVEEVGPALSKAEVRKRTAPAGVQSLPDAPADHVHHHGLMQSLNVDRAGQPIHQVRRQVGRAPPSFADGRIAHEIERREPNNSARSSEQSRRRLQRSDDGRPDRLAWPSELHAPPRREGPTLSDRHDFGLGLRFMRNLNEAVVSSFGFGAPTTIIGEKTTERPRRDERRTAGRWVVVRGAVRGQPLTAAGFETEGFARSTYWLMMIRPSAFVGATLSLHREPLKPEARSPRTRRGRRIARDGRASESELGEERRHWAREHRGKGGAR